RLVILVIPELFDRCSDDARDNSPPVPMEHMDDEGSAEEVRRLRDGIETRIAAHLGFAPIVKVNVTVRPSISCDSPARASAIAAFSIGSSLMAASSTAAVAALVK